MKYDYRHAAIDVLTEFAEDFPGMSLGDILYSSLLEKHLGNKIINIKDFRNISDKNLYESFEKAKNYEKED